MDESSKQKIEDYFAQEKIITTSTDNHVVITHDGQIILEGDRKPDGEWEITSPLFSTIKTYDKSYKIERIQMLMETTVFVAKKVGENNGTI